MTKILNSRYCHHNIKYDDDPQHELKSKEIFKRFHIDKILGKGAFATVWKARLKKKSDGNEYYNKFSQNDGQMKACVCCLQQPTTDNNLTEIVSLKVINVTKVINRRRSRKTMDNHCDKKETKSTLPQDFLSSEYDTDALFFPSRIMQKNNHSMCSEDGNDNDDESATIKKMINREILVHMSISRQNHPNIVSMLESFQYSILSHTSTRDYIVAMVMEYCPYGDLQQYLKQKRDNRQATIEIERNGMHSGCMIPTLLDEREIKHAMRHILRGLAFLHSHGIVHRDIKAGNILLSTSTPFNQGVRQYLDNDAHILNGDSFSLLDCCLKIGDFGLAVKMSDDDDWDEAQHTICGTPSFLAPEVALSTPTLQKGDLKDDLFISNRCFTQKGISFEDIQGHGQPADLWSAGCLFYTMLVGRYPFTRTNRQTVCKYGELHDKQMKVKETLGNIIHGKWSIPPNVLLSAFASNLLTQLLSMDPKRRGFARGILSTHPFFEEPKVDNNVLSNTNLFHDTVATTCTASRAVLQCTSNTCYNQKIVTESNCHLKHVQMNDIIKQKRRSASMISKTFITPLKDIHDLLPMKYQWESKTKTKDTNSNEEISLSFSLFILPDKRGVVFQCEKTNSGLGAWMFVRGDGDHICLGKLSKSPQLLRLDENISKNQLLNEAFSCCPKKIYALDDSHFWSSTKYKNDNESMCTMAPLCNTTIYSTPSTNSEPLKLNGSIPQIKFKRLSCLLQRKNRVFLSLYKKLSKIVKKLKEKTTRIHLSIHEADMDKSRCYKAGKLLCTATLLNDQTSVIIVNFVDGFNVRYDRSTGVADISGFQEDKHSLGTLSVHLQSNNIKAVNRMNDNKTKDGGDSIVAMYFVYLQFARSAIKKLISIEQEMVHTEEPPIRRIIVVVGKSFKSWVDVTKSDLSIDENEQHIQRVTSGTILNRKFIDGIHDTSLSLLGQNIS